MSTESMKFTDKGIKGLKPRSKTETYWRDGGGGYGVRVSPKGKKTFVFRYKFIGKSRLITIGQYGKLTLKEANEEHSRLAAEVEKGADPWTNKRNAKRLKEQSPTFAQFVDTYIKKYCIGPAPLSPNKKSYKAEERLLKADAVPVMGDIKMLDITRKDIAVCINRVVDRGAVVMANRLLSALKTMFTFAVTRGVIDSNPCRDLKKQTKEKPRDRILDKAEIKELWAALDTAKGKFFQQNKNNIFKMLLVTGQRLSEVRLMEWSEITDGVWTIPAQKTKNGDEHSLPLPAMANEILDWQRKATGKQQYIFSGKRNGGEQYGMRPFEQTALSHAFKRIVVGLEWEEPATSHDLRRTMRSMLSGLNVQPIVAEKLLNHRLGKVHEIYDNFDYTSDIGVALQKWSTCLEGIVYPGRKVSNIVEFTKKNLAV